MNFFIKNLIFFVFLLQPLVNAMDPGIDQNKAKLEKWIRKNKNIQAQPEIKQYTNQLTAQDIKDLRELSNTKANIYNKKEEESFYGTIGNLLLGSVFTLFSIVAIKHDRAHNIDGYGGPMAAAFGLMNLFIFGPENYFSSKSASRSKKNAEDNTHFFETLERNKE